MIHQFDDHRFYKQLAGQHVKGVDFIGVFQEKTLVLMEVKNYIDRYFKDDTNPSEIFLTNRQFYLEKIIKKFDDSLRVIQAVRRAYCKKWWYRLAEKTLFRWIKMERMLHWEFVFWTVAWQLVEAKELRFVLWLEIEKGVTQMFEIKSEKQGVPIEISSCSENLFAAHLQVKLIKKKR